MNTSPNPSPARVRALEILNRFEKSRVYVNLLEQRGSSEADLSDRDRMFAHLLITGVLKNLSRLDWNLSDLCSRPLAKLPIPILNVLRLGAFELLCIPDKPPAVVVHEYVALARLKGHEGTARLTNAILRKISQAGADVALPRDADDPVKSLAVRYSHPEWMVERWIRQFGPEGTERLCEFNNESAQVCLRVNTLKTSREEAISALRNAGLSCRESTLAEFGIVLESSLSQTGIRGIRQLPGFKEGEVTIQDEAAQLVVAALDPREAEVLVEACSAPGGKTTHIAALMRNRGKVVAVESHPGRMQLVKENCERLGVANVELVIGDFIQFAATHKGIADACLMDAPCSGTGVLRRKPDIRWSRGEASLTALVDLQLRLLHAAAMVVKPGGRIVYSTCSLEPEENREVVARFIESSPGLRLQPFDRTSRLPTEVVTDQGFLYCVPHHHKTDGAFAARLIR